MKLVSPEECAVFATAKRQVAEAHRLIGQACIDLITHGSEVTLAAAEALRKIEREIGFVPYNFLTPQSEWLGGSLEENAYRYRWPHGLGGE